MNTRVIDVAHRATMDIDPTAGIDAAKLEGHIKRCVSKVTDALTRPMPKLSEYQRHNLAEIFDSLGYTHETIRDLLRHGYSRPISADALPLTRLQVEALYAVCLMVEDLLYISLYLKNSWWQVYVRYLLQTLECQDLPGFSEWIRNRARLQLEQLRQIAGVTDEEVATVEFEEMGKPLPAGSSPTHIPMFPTPKKTMRRIREPTRKRMLLRLYPEYQVLSAYVHGASTHFRVFKTLFNPRSKYRNLFSSGELQEMFQRVGEEAFWLSYLSIVQTCTEVVDLYPGDAELYAALSDAWTPLTEGSLVGRAIWEIRSRVLLGVITS